ncbi:MAG: hypothetical protein GC200_01025 [Tepidisphaera sp.]|nr:hypothetical protein [Tepidisphaera sp.]
MHRSFHFRSHRLLVAWAAAIALLLVSSATLWHHHDDRGLPHSDCAVCLAAAMDKSDGLPPPRFAPAPPLLIEVRAVPTWQSALLAPTRRPTSRGPPAI